MWANGGSTAVQTALSLRSAGGLHGFVRLTCHHTASAAAADRTLVRPSARPSRVCPACSVLIGNLLRYSGMHIDCQICAPMRFIFCRSRFDLLVPSCVSAQHENVRHTKGSQGKFRLALLLMTPNFSIKPYIAHTRTYSLHYTYTKLRPLNQHFLFTLSE